ncbi:hypothetical protein C8J57DRAFT_1235906 [Mycena rebaudengoi]|nr:hypothetical protein C8J57DRAFT_1255940 [Mycena rebaudengoi]KAJ7256010.1 hypothetical protein C8J57DRAFT_1235906 [Mycena rebaudengoi]
MRTKRGSWTEWLTKTHSRVQSRRVEATKGEDWAFKWFTDNAIAWLRKQVPFWNGGKHYEIVDATAKGKNVHEKIPVNRLLPFEAYLDCGTERVWVPFPSENEDTDASCDTEVGASTGESRLPLFQRFLAQVRAGTQEGWINLPRIVVDVRQLLDSTRLDTRNLNPCQLQAQDYFPEIWEITSSGCLLAFSVYNNNHTRMQT